MADRKLIELLIDEDTENFGVEAISLVRYPAIESNFVYFSKQDKKRAMYSMTSIDEDKRTLIGPALIPDKIIPRYDEFSDEEYDVYFSKQTVQHASELFLKKNMTNNHTFEHQEVVEGVHVVESWIVSDPEMDKSKHYGLSVPEGTWMVRVHVANDDMWTFVKEQKVAGFSIEGYFLDKVENMSDTKREPSWFKKLEALVTGRKFYAEIVTDNGQTFATEEDAFEPGVKAFKIGAEGTMLEVSNGQYKTKAGTTFEVFDSVVTEWDGEVQATEQKPVEETKAELMKKYEAKLKQVELNSLSDCMIWLRFYNSNAYYSDPESLDVSFEPLTYNSFDDFVRAIEDKVKEVEADYPGFVVDEQEPVDWQMMPEPWWVLNEPGWDNLKEAHNLAKLVDVNVHVIIEAFTDLMDSDDDINRWWDDKVVWSGSLKEYAYDLVESGTMEGAYDNYFDFEKFGRDVEYSGEFADMLYEDLGEEEGEKKWFGEYEHLPSHKLADAYLEYLGIYQVSELGTDTLKNYFDYDGFARDLSMDGYDEYGSGNNKFVVWQNG
jgi:hypothetical protein